MILILLYIDYSSVTLATVTPQILITIIVILKLTSIVICVIPKEAHMQYILIIIPKKCLAAILNPHRNYNYSKIISNRVYNIRMIVLKVYMQSL